MGEISEMATQEFWTRIYTETGHVLSVHVPRKYPLIEDFREDSEHQLWRLEDDRKLRNKALGLEWKFGDQKWERQGYFLVQQDGKVLEVDFAIMEVNCRAKHGRFNQRWYFNQIIE